MDTFHVTDPQGKSQVLAACCEVNWGSLGYWTSIIIEKGILGTSITLRQKTSMIALGLSSGSTSLSVNCDLTAISTALRKVCDRICRSHLEFNLCFAMTDIIKEDLFWQNIWNNMERSILSDSFIFTILLFYINIKNVCLCGSGLLLHLLK